MRRTKSLVSLALAACISAGLLTASPVLKADAAEPGIATMSDAEAGDILKEDAETITDVNGFVWSKENVSLLVGYTGQDDVVKIPSKCTGIADGAFSVCGMTSVEIPASVNQIGKGIFSDCIYLEKITVNAGNKIYNSNGNCNAIIETKSNTLVAGCKGTVIPSSVTGIGERAFYTCRMLTSITIPASVTSIADEAFLGCINLQTITIPSSVTSIGSDVYAGCGQVNSIVVNPANPVYNSNGNSNAIIETKTNKLVIGCQNTRIPSNVTSIGRYAFDTYDTLTSIYIPSSVTSIEEDAFSGCSNLKEIKGHASSYAETYAKEHGYCFIDIDTAAITVPTVMNLKAVAAGKNKVWITWDKVASATGYIVYAKKNGNYAKLDVTAATSYTDKAALDTDYNFYFVYAYKKDPTGKIVVGKCQKYAYAKGTCKAVTNLKASSVKGGVKVTWTKSADADGYIVYGKRPGGTYGYVGMTSKNTATSFTDKGADKKNYNFYWVFPYHNKNGKRVIGPICGYVYGKAK